jgi:FkbM family methyltransferase
MPPPRWQALHRWGTSGVSRRLAVVLAGLVKGLSALQKPVRRANTRLLTAQLLLQPRHVPTVHGNLAFIAAHPQALDHIRHFATREPETLAWIDGFAAPAVFWDIGANIGLYALYAGLRTGIEILAFEPAAANYEALCRNIAANGLGEGVQAYCVALGDRTTLGRLTLSGTNPGSVYNAFEPVEDGFGRPRDGVVRQGVLGFSIDGLRAAFGLPPPNYLKIDVDGTEEHILAGALKTLRDRALRSLLLELDEADTARNRRLAAALAASGFELVHKSAGNRGGSVNGIFNRRQGEPV